MAFYDNYIGTLVQIAIYIVLIIVVCVAIWALFIRETNEVEPDPNAKSGIASGFRQHGRAVSNPYH